MLKSVDDKDYEDKMKDALCDSGVRVQGYAIRLLKKNERKFRTIYDIEDRELTISQLVHRAITKACTE